MTDAQMMTKIRADFGDYIAGAVEGTPFPATLLGAIVANESSGIATATRFEPAVLAALAQVLTEQKLAYGPPGIKAPIVAPALLAYAVPLHVMVKGAPAEPMLSFAGSLLALINLSTSWGPTQIMGWHALEMGYPLGEITNIEMHFEHAVQLLTHFYEMYGMEPLSPDACMTALLHCWNTGSPTAPTFDLGYAAKGLKRAELYDAAA